MLSTFDNNYLIAASSVFDMFLLKVDVMGDMVWSRRLVSDLNHAINAESVVQTEDGGFALVGRTYDRPTPTEQDVVLVKTDNAGIFAWAKVYTGPLCPYCLGCAYTIANAPGGDLIIGGIMDPPNGQTDPFLLKVDDMGNVHWFTIYSQAGFNDRHGAYSVRLTSDDGFAFVKYDIDLGIDQAVLYKTDHSGAIEWAKEFGYPNQSQRFCSVVEAGDGGYLMGGIDHEDHFYMVKVNDLGKSECNQQDLSISLASALYDSYDLVVFNDVGFANTPPPTVLTRGTAFEDSTNCICCVAECDVWAGWGDANGDQIGLSISDMVRIAQVLTGDEDDFSPCGAEMDGFKNPYSTCTPTLGDLIAYQNFANYGIGALPPQNCSCLANPLSAQVSMVMENPIILPAHGGTRYYTVSLVNNGVDDLDILGAEVSLDFSSQNGPANITVTYENFQSQGGWDHLIRTPAPKKIVAIIYRMSAPYGVLLPASGGSIDLFDIKVVWPVTTSQTRLNLNYFVSSPAFAPNVTAVYSSKRGASDATWPVIGFSPTLSCCSVPGDANNDGGCNLGDAGYIINYIFYDGPDPVCSEEGDANADGGVNLGDAGFIINYIFYDGPDPACGF